MQCHRELGHEGKHGAFDEWIIEWDESESLTAHSSAIVNGGGS